MKYIKPRDIVIIGHGYSNVQPPKKRYYTKAIPVAGRSFVEYLSYRMIKDNLSFVAIGEQMMASTQIGSHISSVIPESIEDLLVYFHELGHNKSRQPPKESKGFYAGFSSCRGTIDCEYNAWVWAIRYFRRLGYTMTSSCQELIKEAFLSYLNVASDYGHASVRANQMSRLIGTDISVINRNVISKEFTITRYADYAFDNPKPEVKKPEGWKPWHDLKQKQQKKSWRNQK